jgi:dihydrofolate synthase/folylpolyglutamate synthase
VTSVDVDHEEWLGCDRNQIAREKLGISRPTTPMIIAEEKLTPSLIDFSQHHDATSVLHHDFLIKEVKKDEAPMTWQWWPSNNAPALTLPMPELPLTSVVAGLQALYVANVLPSITQLQTVLLRLQLKGRYQQEIINGKKVIFDVAHNPAAAKALASKLSASLAPGQKTIAVFALMADKDKHAIIHALTDVIDCWYYASLADNPRSASTASMGLVLQPLVNRAIAFEQIEDAFVAALNESSEYDRIIVFGSFFTVTAIQQNWVNRTD